MSSWPLGPPDRQTGVLEAKLSRIGLTTSGVGCPFGGVDQVESSALTGHFIRSKRKR